MEHPEFVDPQTVVEHDSDGDGPDEIDDAVPEDLREAIRGERRGGYDGPGKGAEAGAGASGLGEDPAPRAAKGDDGS